MKRYISASSMKLPAGFKKRSLRWIKDNFDLDFLEDDKMDCEAAEAGNRSQRDSVEIGRAHV